jgi:hypothetical protein
MHRVWVYRFRYFNRRAGRYEVSADYATARAIREIGAEMIADSAMEVDAGRVSSPSGYLIAERKVAEG